VPTKSTKPHTKGTLHEATVTPEPLAPIVIGKRTVLPPLEVEVVAGDAHQTVRPGSNSVKVDLQSRPPVRAAAQPPLEIHTDPPVVASNAAERARVSTVAASVVTESVRPDYPMLARQMKVQGSVVLQALVGRDGMIQDLQVLSGPPILSTAAREAVRQWHFKPHYLGNQTVETETRITVNFTISTN
jgi:protein TonB